MATIDVEGLRGLVDAGIAAVSVLGGLMACTSGYAARQAVLKEASAETLSQRVNEGLASGFGFGAPTAAIAFIIFA